MPHVFDGMRARFGEATRGLPRAFWVLWLGTFITRTGTFVVPFMALYLTEKRHFSATHAGMVASLYGAGGVIAAPLGGWLTDRIGRKAVMVGALGCGGLGMALLGFAENLTTIAVLFFLVALISEMYRPGMQAAISDLVPPEDRVRAFGLIYWVVNLGFSAGLLIGGVVSGMSYLALFVADGLTSLVFAALVWLWVPETLPEATSANRAAPSAASSPYQDRTFMGFVFLSMLTILVFMQHSTVMALDVVAHGVSKASFGAIIAMNGILIVLVQPFLAPMISAWDRSRALAFGTVLVGLGFGFNAFAGSPALYTLGVVIWTFGEMSVLPVATAVVSDMAPAQSRGRYQGAYGLAWGVGGFLAPLLGTFVLERMGTVVLWLGCLGLASLVAFGQLMLGPRLRAARALRAPS